MLFQITDQQQEYNRLKALYDYKILDTGPEESYEALLNVTSSIFKTPFISIAFVDQNRLWFKSKKGITSQEIDRITSYCHYTIQSDEVLEIKDAQGSKLFPQPDTNSQHVLRFYAGAPLITPDNYRIGTLCIADFVPKTLSSEEKIMLQALAKQVMTQLELDNCNRQLQTEKTSKAQLARQQDNYRSEFDQIAYAVSHELKTPLRAINNLAEWVSEELNDSPSHEVSTNLSLMRSRVNRLEHLFNGLITYSQAQKSSQNMQEVDLTQLLNNLTFRMQKAGALQLELASDLPTLLTEKEVLESVFWHLIQNAMQHNADRFITVKIGHLKLSETELEFYVEDNGVGIAQAYHEKIFGMFKTIKPWKEHKSVGIGLPLVRRILHERNAAIRLKSAEKGGCRFMFTWPTV